MDVVRPLLEAAIDDLLWNLEVCKLLFPLTLGSELHQY